MDPDRLHRLVEQADLEDDEEVQQLLALASAVENDHAGRQIRRLIGLKAADYVAHPFDTPDTSGTIRLGTVPRAGELRLDREALNRHMLVIGQTGAGKTTLFFNLIDQVDVPV
ncbi:MAG: DUF87 domain-containing protein, partial [Candidatus Nanohaloarchaea archaeon]|nr:DUF87 domain-containing protein [Candidatus Nanohaloarchaea archaeon]